MKKILLFFAIASLIARANAAVLLVNNSTNSPAPYTDITAAMAAANSGDTLVIAGSISGYGNITITKPLTIIGTGANPQKQLPYTSVVGTIGMSVGLSNVKVTGLIITGTFTMASGTNNFNIEYCYLTSVLQLNNNCNNNRISNCIFTNTTAGGARNIDGFDVCGGYYGGCTNLLIQNCIFNGAVSGINIPGTVIQNNIFIGSYPAFYGVNVYNNGGCYSPSYIVNGTIQNNIFYRADPIAYTSGCSVNNNLSYSPSGTFGAMIGNSNLDNTNPQFTNFPAAGDLFNYSYNFHLSATSPGYNAGTDGNDIGLYGGTFPVSNFGETYNMPVVRQMNIGNTNVAPNGNINVKVRSTVSKVN